MSDIKKSKGLESSKVVKLAELTDYAEDSVVSRTLIGNDSGTITIFAFSAGQEISKHSAPFDALVNILEGKAKIMINNKEFLLSGGESILMPADIPHAIHSEENFKMLLVLIKGK
ncbi:MAG: cupin domain-containing protein [Candidatus Aminicenantes bacterium]|nr:cupin domain-containing protein [Candidatus Aminicenantes bacterium]